MDTSPTTRLLHRLCRAAAGRSRSQPVLSVRKCLLQPVIRGGRRPWRLRPCRPVTPEVAGSSPVARAKLPANGHVLLSAQRPDRGQLHTRSIEPTRTAKKGRKRRSGAHDFKPILADAGSAAKAACDYTKWPEVKVRQSSADADLRRATRVLLRLPPRAVSSPGATGDELRCSAPKGLGVVS